jgi:rhamnopyranosyl-N-acetylglucosaminyl-diphospho-decaprenol beta-1,3/1,4-galactofuranosyltransferase
MEVKKICAVIVTYNRKELLVRCINSLFRQTCDFDVLVYDNHSTDGTREYLSEKGVMNSIIYHYADKNTGGSGGFHNGMKIAMERDCYDYLWLMDDDGYAVSENTLAFLLDAIKYTSSDLHIINSLVICNESKELCFTLKGLTTYEDVIKIADEKGLVRGAINPFNGTLVSSKLIEAMGYPRKEFFVYGDETEYMLRAQKNGAELITVTSSVYFHPSMPKVHKKVLWMNVDTTDMPAWKIYYAKRNMAYVNKTYFGMKRFLSFVLHSNKEILVYKKDRFYKIAVHYRGLLDGFFENFSHEINLKR